MQAEQPWLRIVAWATEHAPATAAVIRPPAGAAALRAAELATGGPWPADLVAWFGLHDGTERTPAGYLLPGQRPLPVNEVADAWARMQAGEDQLRRQWVVNPDEHSRALNLLAQTPGASLPPGPYDVDRLEAELAGTIAGMFLPSFVPIAENQSGDHLILDLRPGPRQGCVVRYRKESAALDGSEWPSIAAMLGDVATALETGGTTGYWVPAVDRDRLDWDIAISS